MGALLAASKDSAALPCYIPKDTFRTAVRQTDRFMREGSEMAILLAGGDKSTPERDIVAARALATQLRDKP